jgi:hypothetical protein
MNDKNVQASPILAINFNVFCFNRNTNISSQNPLYTLPTPSEDEISLENTPGFNLIKNWASWDWKLVSTIGIKKAQHETASNLYRILLVHVSPYHTKTSYRESLHNRTLPEPSCYDREIVV